MNGSPLLAEDKEFDTIKGIVVELTMVGGRVVHERDGATAA